MPAIPTALTHRLHDTLARCNALESDRALRAVFVDARLAPWINRVPENTPDRATRVSLLIATLCDQTAANGDNALILLLYVLAEQTPPGDALHDELAYLATELQAAPPAALADLAAPVTSATPFLQIGQHVNQQLNIAHLVINVSQPALPAAAVPFQTLNPPEPFIDRAALRELLNAQLRAGGAHLLCGIGGVGKTALALRVAQDLIDARAFLDGVLWIPLEGAPTAEIAAAWILAAYGIQGEQHPLGALAGLLRQRRPLLILDNAEAAKDTADILLADRGQAAVLVTSRDATVGLQTIHDIPTDLAPLETSDAVLLLQSRLGTIPASNDLASAISELVGGLPLALTLAAAFITRRLRRERDPLAAYLALLRRTPLAALELGDRRDTSVRVTFDLSWQVLSPTARDVLGVLAVIPGDSADDAALHSVLQIDAATFESALWQLGDYSLLIQTGERYSLHPLLRHYVTGQLPAEQAAAYRARLYAYYLAYAQAHAVRAGQLDYVPLEAERANVLGAMAWAWEREDWLAIITFAEAVHRYLQLRGYWQVWRERAAWRLHAARQLRDNGEIAVALLRLAEMHRMLAEYAEARLLLEEALPLYRATSDQLGEANALTDLGDVHFSLDAYAEAQACHEAALSLYRAIGARLGEANTLLSLGDIHAMLDAPDAARACYENALSLYQENGERLGEANTHKSLGDVHFGQGAYKEARAHYDAALLLYRAIGDRMSEANTLRALGNLHFALAEYAEARACLDEALPICRAIGDRLGEANVYRGLADLEYFTENYTAASALYHQALDSYKALDVPFNIAFTLQCLGYTAIATGDLVQARACYQEALTIFTAIGSPAAADVQAELDALSSFD